VASFFENFRKHSQIWKVSIVVALFDFWIEQGSGSPPALMVHWLLFLLGVIICDVFDVQLCWFAVWGECNDYQSPPATSTPFLPWMIWKSVSLS
jgi:hypothetical protein